MDTFNRTVTVVTSSEAKLKNIAVRTASVGDDLDETNLSFIEDLGFISGRKINEFKQFYVDYARIQ